MAPVRIYASPEHQYYRAIRTFFKRKFCLCFADSADCEMARNNFVTQSEIRLFRIPKPMDRFGTEKFPILILTPGGKVLRSSQKCLEVLKSCRGGLRWAHPEEPEVFPKRTRSCFGVFSRNASECPEVLLGSLCLIAKRNEEAVLLRTCCFRRCQLCLRLWLFLVLPCSVTTFCVGSSGSLRDTSG